MTPEVGDDIVRLVHVSFRVNLKFIFEIPPPHHPLFFFFAGEGGGVQLGNWDAYFRSKYMPTFHYRWDRKCFGIYLPSLKF